MEEMNVSEFFEEIEDLQFTKSQLLSIGAKNLEDFPYLCLDFQGSLEGNYFHEKWIYEEVNPGKPGDEKYCLRRRLSLD